MDHIVLTVIVSAMGLVGLALGLSSMRPVQARAAPAQRGLAASPADAVPQTLFGARRR